MKLKGFYIFSILLITLTLSQFLFAQLSEEILIQRKNAVVLVKAYMPGDVVETGSGIIVGYDHSTIYIMTARHVVEQDDKTPAKVVVEFYNKPTSIKEATVFRTDPDQDLAVLHTAGADLMNSIKPLPIADFSQPLLESHHRYNSIAKK